MSQSSQAYSHSLFDFDSHETSVQHPHATALIVTVEALKAILAGGQKDRICRHACSDERCLWGGGFCRRVDLERCLRSTGNCGNSVSTTIQGSIA